MSGRRILFLVSAMTAGGAERVAATLSNHWAAQGDDVTLMPTFSGRGECAYHLHPGVRLEYLADRTVGGRGWLLPLRRLLALRRAIRQSSPDIVVSFLTNVNIAALLATMGMRVPVIASERTYPPMQKIAAGWAFLRRLTYWRARHIVAQSARAAQWLETNCPGSRVTVIPNPVEWPLVASTPVVSPESILKPERHVLLAVGRLVPLKGFDALLRAFARNSAALSDWDLVILGEGPERARLEMLCAEAGLSERVFLPGRVGNPGDWYARAGVLALTSHYEGFPNVLVEALASGVPVVALDCPVGPGEIVRNGVDGFLVPPAAGVDGLAAALLQLMQDGGLRAAMGERGKEARIRFSANRISGMWSKILDL